MPLLHWISPWTTITLRMDKRSTIWWCPSICSSPRWAWIVALWINKISNWVYIIRIYATSPVKVLFITSAYSTCSFTFPKGWDKHVELLLIFKMFIQLVLLFCLLTITHFVKILMESTICFSFHLNFFDNVYLMSGKDKMY